MADAAQALMDMVPTLHLAPRGTQGEFRARIAGRAIGNLGLLAHAITACEMEADDSSKWHLVLHCTGQGAVSCEGRDYTIQAGAEALIMPEMRRRSSRTASSAVTLIFEPDRLEATLATMAGSPDQPRRLADHPEPLDLQRDKGFYLSFLHACRLLDATAHGGTDLAETLGLDDLFYRWAATALMAQRPDPLERRGRLRNSALDVVCDLVRTTGERSLTLTEMEAVSGLSARALQYAFRDRFGCSPMQWQRRERLILAQQRLLQFGPEISVTRLAHAMGFSSSAAFTTVYKRQFGETPSQTRERAKG